MELLLAVFGLGLVALIVVPFMYFITWLIPKGFNPANTPLSREQQAKIDQFNRTLF